MGQHCTDGRRHLSDIITRLNEQVEFNSKCNNNDKKKMLYSLNERNTLKKSQFIYIAPFKHLLYKIKLKPKINEVIKAEII